MLKEYIAYIDEAGDEGFGKLRDPENSGQSRWLALGAAIVSAENDKFIPSWRDEIISLFPNRKSRDLHFRNLKHEQKVAACRRLSEKSLGVCVILSNKETLLDSPKKNVFKQPGYLYNYLVRYLLERATSACHSAAIRDGASNARLSIVFSRRGGTNYQSMVQYLELMRSGKEIVQPVRSIRWDVLSPADIRVENHSVRAGLQIADVLTSATCAALEPNGFGFCEPRYALSLKTRYLKRDGNVLNCGITLVPPAPKSPLSLEQRQFLNDICS